MLQTSQLGPLSLIPLIAPVRPEQFGTRRGYPCHVHSLCLRTFSVLAGCLHFKRHRHVEMLQLPECWVSAALVCQ